MDPRFSICVPACNRPDTLRWSVESVLAQTYDDFEIIVSDNASNPPLRGVIDAFDDARLRYIRHERLLSPSAHWEFVLQQGRGEFLLLLADDDGLVPSALQRVANLADDTHAATIQVGQGRYTHPLGHGPGENRLLVGVRSDVPVCFDAARLTRTICAAWGIGVEPTPVTGIPSLHPSGLFMNGAAVRARAARGEPVCAHPFADVGFLAIALEDAMLHCCDLPLAIIGVDMARELNGPLPGSRRVYDAFLPGTTGTPLTAVTFTNLAVASHLDIARRSRERLGNPSLELQGAYYVNHGVELLEDAVHDRRWFADVGEWLRVVSALPASTSLPIVTKAVYRRLTPEALKRLMRTLRAGAGGASPLVTTAPEWIDGDSNGFHDLPGCARFIEATLGGERALRDGTL